MSGAKHTPGPWQIWPGPAYCGGGEDLCIGAGKTWLVNMDHRNCKSRDAHFAALAAHDQAGLETDTDICSFSDEITEEQRANANLIAAAPDLLEAAKHAAMEWRLHGQLTDSCRVLEAAVAKAEGCS